MATTPSTGKIMANKGKIMAKRRWFVLTMDKKVELVKRLEKGESRVKLMADYGVSSSTLYNLKKQKE